MNMERIDSSPWVLTGQPVLIMDQLNKQVTKANKWTRIKPTTETKRFLLTADQHSWIFTVAHPSHTSGWQCIILLTKCPFLFLSLFRFLFFLFFFSVYASTK